MNSNYKSVFNKKTGTWVAVSELKSVNGKKATSGSIKKAVMSTIVAVGLLHSLGAQATILEIVLLGLAAAVAAPVVVVGAVGAAAVGVAALATAAVGTAAVGTAAVVTGAAGITAAVLASGPYSAGGVWDGKRGSISIAANEWGTTTDHTTTAEGALLIATGWDDDGSKSIASGSHSIALGTNVKATGTGGIAIGRSSNAAAEGAISFGWDSQATATNSLAFGSTALAEGVDSTAIGRKSIAAFDNNVSLGANSVDKAAVAVRSATIGSAVFENFAGKAAGVVSVGSKGAERQIVNVAPGAITATSTDAVNGSQLYSALSGLLGVVDLVTGETVTAPILTGSADTDTVVSGNNAVASGDKAVAIGKDSLASGANSVALGAGSVAAEDNTVSVGSAGNERRITNVAAGINATDAVNVNQLNSEVSKINDNMTKMSKKAYAGVASALALDSAPHVAGAWTYSVGAGYYEGESAIGVGVRRTAISNRWSVMGGVTKATAGTGVGGRVAVSALLGVED